MKYKINKKFFLQIINDKAVIFDTTELNYYTFNETATYIFTKIKAGVNDNKIVDLVAERYQIQRDKIIPIKI